MLNLDTNKITSEGGLRAKEAAEMQMQPNLLAEMSLAGASEQAPVEYQRQHRRRLPDLGAHAQLDGVRAQPANTACGRLCRAITTRPQSA